MDRNTRNSTGFTTAIEVFIPASDQIGLDHAKNVKGDGALEGNLSKLFGFLMLVLKILLIDEG